MQGCGEMFFERELLKNVYNYFYSFKTNFIVLLIKLKL